jgi:hypothetical protein
MLKRPGWEIGSSGAFVYCLHDSALQGRMFVVVPATSVSMWGPTHFNVSATHLSTPQNPLYYMHMYTCPGASKAPE